MQPFSESTEEERTTTRTQGYYEEQVANLAELDDATTEMMPRTQSKLINVYGIFIAELDALKGKIVQQEARIALLMKLRGEYREEVEMFKTYKHTVKKYQEEIKKTEQSSTLQQTELDALKASLHEQIRRLTVERDEQRAKLEELSAALAKEQAARRDLADELTKKEKTITSLRETADETTRRAAAAQGVLHSEINALKDAVAQQTTQISSLEAEIEHERLKHREAEGNFATSRRTLEIELELKSTAYGDVQRQAADAEISSRAEREALRTQISEADAKFKQELWTLQDRLRREQEDTAKWRSQHDRLLFESGQSAQEIQSELSGAVAKYEQERKLRSEKEAMIDAMRADAEDSRAENTKLQSQVSSSSTEIANLQKKLQTVQVDAEQNERDASERIRVLQRDLTSAHGKLKSAQDAHDGAMSEMRTTAQALEKKLKSSEQELERLRGTLQATQSATLHSQDVYRKEVETLQRQLSVLQQELKDAEQSQTASSKESQTSRERIKVLEQGLSDLGKQLETTESESVRIRETSQKAMAAAQAKLAEKDTKIQQLQDAAKQTVMDVEIKFQEKLKNSRTEFTQLVQIIIERDKLILRTHCRRPFTFFLTTNTFRLSAQSDSFHTVSPKPQGSIDPYSSPYPALDKGSSNCQLIAVTTTIIITDFTDINTPSV
ncbi:hypothetical protein C8F04DRAFT_1392015 [Mycena alexandri]|uniref:Uncharacterized protein n=1 Tax=Mycena alexandri TaxID=1745969 RepID=A0AAD6X5S7_9AGAR|nr:hypothetical protein C8F04DRAFT_1392015 [Mycena alexandri]